MKTLQSILTFNGTSDYIEIPYKPALNPAQFTLSCWVKVTGGQGLERWAVSSSRSEPAQSGYLLKAGTDNKWQFLVGDGSIWQQVIGADIALNTWTHVAATYDGSTMRLYLNGQPVGTPMQATMQANPSRPLLMGATTVAVPDFFLPGQITEVRLWNRARSQTEIAQTLNRRLQGNETGLIAYWPLHAGSGTAALDWSGQNNSGLLQGGTWNEELLDFLTGMNLLPALALQPAVLPALSLDGTDDVVACGSGIDLTNKSFTIEGWFKRTASDRADFFIHQGPNTPDSNGLHIGFRDTNVFTFAFVHNDFDTTATYTDSQWHHWSCVYDAASNQRTVYRDGEAVAGAVIGRSANDPYQGTGIFRIGRVGTGNTWAQGEIAEWRIWSRACTQVEIQTRMNSRLVGNEADLIAYWPFNEGAGTTVQDRSGNGHHGTIAGAAVWIPQAISLNLLQPSLQLLLPSLTFDGLASYADCGSGLDLTNTSFTIEAYVKHEEISQNQMFLCQGQRNPSQGLYLGFRANNLFTFSFWGDEFNTPVTCTDSCWHHWSCTYDSGTNERIIYCDGKEAARGMATASYQGTGNVYLGFGAGDPGTGDMEWFFRGQVAELRIWKTVRTQTEIQASLHRSLSGYETALAAYWPLHEGTGTVVADKTGNGHTGTLVGTGWSRLERSPGTGLADYGYWYRWQQNLPLHIQPAVSSCFHRGRIWA